MAQVATILSALFSKGLQRAAATAAAATTTNDDSDFVVVVKKKTTTEFESEWRPLFCTFFLADSTLHDDLLFFVAMDSDIGISVRRKLSDGSMPDLKGLEVNWCETFFLNLIVQMHCSLTVSVCKRDSSGAKRHSSANVEKVLGSTASTASHQQPQQTPSTTTTSSTSPAKSRMVALRRITKKVYAAPYKSRMDVKDAFMNEIAYPLVYYTVNDYESTDLHLHIQEREYLCVELSVLIPSNIDTTQLRDSLHSSTSSTMPLPPSVAEDSTPFPVPQGFKKVVLFQGAVPYTALLDVFLQKSSTNNSSILPKSDWGNLTNSKSNTSLNGIKGAQERTEYIMMRGPRGKGVCQVAICENILSDPTVVDSKLSSSPPTSSGVTTASISNNASSAANSSLLGMLSGTVKTGISILRSALGEDSGSQEANNRKPDALRCSMTYVNVPWHSIISDLVTAREAGTI
ncbi:hypothetical protein BCR33DRAFT_717550 [Rhizoclosmatium globosum]|uniref:Uncharacterized protein n=1 Tax=Rhizoclosmatium globosum TaxID=329046 RepID=A0A1Y2C8G3_9FUNG|nr:hypothetical protein BCR33DRAFT_717550 [Rhizoclosmatium globosum]|eukprot:ORY43319.1 hypothetical protein BCR33DRAFT_717550 [Rhizoclosmatium globosum]